jgi:multicomponent Na+:H+ antiporter subunit B
VTATDQALLGLLGFVVLAAAATAAARTLLTTLVAFAAYSLGLAMVWVVFRAPDVALTEAAVGAGVTTALFLLLLRRANDPGLRTRRETPAWHVRPASVAVGAVVTLSLLLTVPSLPPVGAADTPSFGPVATFYLTDSADRGIDNVVTAVLVVYRGFDTFGEIAVVFTAAVAVLAVFGREVVL